MLIRDCMTRHPVLAPLSMRASEAQALMTENNIRHLPIVGDGKRLTGLITRERLAVKADMLGSLNVWEISRFLSDQRVRDLMVKTNDLITISPDRTVERAAAMMTEHKIGCLPVVENGDLVVGIEFAPTPECSAPATGACAASHQVNGLEFLRSCHARVRR